MNERGRAPDWWNCPSTGKGAAVKSKGLHGLGVQVQGGEALHEKEKARGFREGLQRVLVLPWGEQL